MSYVAGEPDTRKGDIENHIFNAVSSSDINKNNRLYAVGLFHVINEVSLMHIVFIRNFVLFCYWRYTVLFKTEIAKIFSAPKTLRADSTKTKIQIQSRRRSVYLKIAIRRLIKIYIDRLGRFSSSFSFPRSPGTTRLPNFN